jgi:hypothetical protein
MNDLETYTQPHGCPLCGCMESEWVGRCGDTPWVRCCECKVQYVLEDVEEKLEESRR